MLESRDLWGTAPPEPRSRLTNWPTLLFSWWCTSFAAVIIITRLCGRKVRSNTLFREDWIMMISLVPLLIRMVLIHFVLIYGTNNVSTTDHVYSELQLRHHSIGSQLVLPARIFYAMIIWLNKLTVSEFLKRITIRVWRRSWELTLQGIRVFLFLTFGAVVVATLSECHPFDHYWQVIPDPGPHCRQGFAQLLTMGTCDIVTDVLLIAFPIPVVLSSGQSWKRKLQMGSLFSLSVIMIAVTATRMPQVVMHAGRQQYRTVWASCEILASVAVSNGVILGSFLRDKGTKKNKYRTFSITDSIERVPTRRPTMATLRADTSEEDLFRAIGCKMPEHLLDENTVVSPRPAPPAPPASPRPTDRPGEMKIPNTGNSGRSSDDSLDKTVTSQAPPPESPSTTRSVNFFDVGHLLGPDGQRMPGPTPAVATRDFATSPHGRYGSRAFLREFGEMLSPGFVRREPSPSHGRDRSRVYGRQESAPTGVLGPMLERHETAMSLQDPGGLLHPNPGPRASGALTASSAAWRPSDEIELVDVSDLLPDDRRRDRGAVSLQEMLRRDGVRRAAGSPSSPRQHINFDDMVLHDPGGLASP